MTLSRKQQSILFDEQFQKLYSFFYYKTLHRETAEDLTSQCFIALAEAVKAKKEIDDPKKFLYGIARIVFTKFLQQKYKRNEFAYDEIDDFSAYVHKEVLDMQERTLEDRAISYIERLPKSQHKVAYMRLIQKYSNQEIAKKLGRDSNYVKTTLRRALRSLEKMKEAES